MSRHKVVLVGALAGAPLVAGSSTAFCEDDTTWLRKASMLGGAAVLGGLGFLAGQYVGKQGNPRARTKELNDIEEHLLRRGVALDGCSSELAKKAGARVVSSGPCQGQPYIYRVVLTVFPFPPLTIWSYRL